ncbi:P-loop containing nucleoside triphosphate hydrolase protein [Crepidotus variabilis]|uniref:P-loop containing nucleoside triphosphate hydrolase protein n=1 Tax=Crepidotus variabilis TaxID=179855 RepID=A0A9P6JKZ5_9AGAR|nr:P-loop containing nucleoside triphosphate hydrolase protein [Crepidotus variabilis]
MSKRSRDNGDDSEPEQGSSSRARRPRVRSPSPNRSEKMDTGVDEDETREHPRAQISFRGSWSQEKWDDFEKALTPKIEERRKRNEGTVGTAAEAGILEKIELYQFMCHKYLTFEFGSQLNFIVGHNGSGKSAVLAGIAVGLGGRAVGTGRGSGVKSLVKEGQSKAETVITLKNAGEFAFRPEQYGDKIIVVRTITKNGSSNYKLKSAQGRVVSTKKAELDLICETFQLQVENPISVLTQDAAKTFLKGSSPELRYKLFLEGTGLQRLYSDYEQAEVQLESTSKTLIAKQEYVKVLKQKLHECRKAFEQSLAAQGLRSQREILIREKGWANAKLKEEELSSRCERLADAEARVRRIDESMTEAQRRFEGLKERIADMQRQHDDFKAKSEGFWNDRKGRQDRLVVKKAEINKLKRDEKSLKNSIEEASLEVSRLTADILEESQNAADSSQPQREAFQQEIGKLRAAAEELKSERLTLQTDLTTSKYRLEDAKARETISKKDLQQKKKEDADLLDGYNKLKEMIASRGDPLTVFGKNVGKVLNAIEEENKKGGWKGAKPIGPLGMYVELCLTEEENRKYAEVLRQLIGYLLRAWAVQDARDLTKMRAILKANGNQGVRVLVSSGDLFDFRSGEPAPEYLTIMRALKVRNMTIGRLGSPHLISQISNEWVKRILIDQNKIERTFLTLTRLDAERILNRVGRGEAISADGMQVKKWSDGGSKNTAMGKELHARDDRYGLFRRANDEQINLAKMIERGKVLQAQIVELGKDYVIAQEDLRNANLEVDKVQASCRVKELEISAKERELTLKIDELGQNEESPIQVEVLQNLRREKAEEQLSFETQLAHIEAQKREVQPEIMVMQLEIDNLKTKAEKEENERRQVADLLEAESVTWAQVRANKTHFENAKKKEEEEKDKFSKAVEDLTTEVEHLRITAEKHGERPRNIRRIDVLERELSRLDGTLTRLSKTQTTSHEELLRELEVAKKQRDDYQEELVSMLNLKQTLTESVKQRCEKCMHYLAWYSLAVQNRFKHLLSTRGYFGTIDFDHIEKKLELKVQTDDMAHDGKNQGSQTVTSSPKKQNLDRKKDPATLSGGEKSLATLSFLISLWDVCQTPLRCLDEFDVYMDSQNRRCSIKMLIDAAKSANGRQTIVITPQSIENVFSEPPVVLIKQMADPRG